MTTRNSNDGPLDHTTARPSNNGPLTVQRRSNDLPLAQGNRTGHNAPLTDGGARVTNDGPMITS